MSLEIPGAPPEILAALDELRTELTHAAGANLIGMVLFGGLARGRFRPGQSDVNLVILLRDASTSALGPMAPALQNAWRRAAVEPMILTPPEIPHAARAFPTKFLDIKNHHLVLHGPDPFTDLVVTREEVRQRTEQELRNLLLRLRNRFVTAHGDPVVLTRILARSARPLALELKALLSLAGAEVPGEDRTATIFEAAATQFGLDSAALGNLAQIRQEARPDTAGPELFQKVLEAVDKAAQMANLMR